MYIYDRQLPGTDTPLRGNDILLRPSERFYYPARLGGFFGNTPTPPKGLKLLDHTHFVKQPHSSNPGQFVTSGPTKLETSDMNPGFIDPSDNLAVDTSSTGLQTCLHNLIKSQFQSYLSSKTATAPSTSDRVHVALVDLTGNKITKPELAGWGSSLKMYGASSPKMLAVYAAHQMRMDLRQLATTQGLSDGKALRKAASANWNIKKDAPDLVTLFDINKWSGNPDTIDFSSDARKAFDKIKENSGAATIISAVGFPYIGSLTWQSGLFHPTRGGQWLTTSYGKGDWDSNPVSGVSSANLTALSAVTFFTLLAQGRLVDDAGSNDIKSVLLHGCVTSGFTLSGMVATKCGFWGDFFHDCVLIDRGSVRYAMAVVTKTKDAELPKYTKLLEELDKLMVNNNKSPRPAC